MAAFIDILNKGTKHWNDWRKKNPNIIPDLSNADLKNKNLDGIDLSNAILRFITIKDSSIKNANFVKADLNGANIESSSLLDSNLNSCLLTEAKILKTDLRGADVSEANLDYSSIKDSCLNGVEFYNTSIRAANLENNEIIGANLSDVDLSNTVLKSCDLTGSMLRHSDLVRTHLDEVNFEDLDFRGVFFAATLIIKPSNIKKCQFSGPCSLDFRTIEHSNKLPLSFYQGVGFPDWKIENAKLYNQNLTPSEINDIIYRIYDLRTNSPIQFYSCFISYSHDDKAFALKLYDSLQKRGVRCWLDEKKLLPGDDIRDKVDEGINIWDKVLLCCSESSLESYWVNNEIDKALKKEENLWKKRKEKVNTLIPLNLDNYLFGWKSSRASTLTDRYAEDLVDWETKPDKFEKALNRIDKALRSDDTGREIPPIPKL